MITATSDRLAALTARLAQSNLPRATLLEVRREALKAGLWETLAARMPQHFGEAFELKATAPAEYRASVVASRAAAVPAENLVALAGKQAFFRIQRAGGHCEVLAGTVKSATPAAITLEEHDIAARQQLTQPGDTFPFPRDANEAFKLEPGDVIVAAIPLPVSVRSSGKPTPRVPLRERALAVEAGTYAPRVDLTRPQDHLARDPTTGEPILDRHGNPVLTTDFRIAVKAELAVVSLPLVHELGNKVAAFLISPEFAQARAEDPTKGPIDLYLSRFAKAHIAELVAEIEAAPGSPMAVALQNFRRVAEFSCHFVWNIEFEYPVEAGLEQGLSSGMEQVAWLVDGAVRKFQAEGIPVASEDISRASYPLALRFAGGSSSVGSYVHGALRRGSLDLDAVELVNRGGGYRMQITAATDENIAKAYGVSLDTRLAGSTGCPLAQSIGRGNPTETLVAAIAHVMVGAAPAAPKEP